MALASSSAGSSCVAGQAIGDGFRAAGLNTEDAGPLRRCLLAVPVGAADRTGTSPPAGPVRRGRDAGAHHGVLPTPWRPPALDFKSEGFVTGMAGQNVRHCRPGDRLRHTGQRGVWRSAVGAGLTFWGKPWIFHDS